MNTLNVVYPPNLRVPFKQIETGSIFHSDNYGICFTIWNKYRGCIQAYNLCDGKIREVNSEELVTVYPNPTLILQPETK